MSTTRIRLAIVAYSLATCFAKTVYGQEPQPSVDQLSAAVESAKSAFVPLTAADREEAKAKLRTAVERLDAKLKAAGEVSGGWREFLMWDKMQQELGKADPDLAVLDAVYARYASGRNGLGFAMFGDFRRHLRHYLVVARAIGNNDLPDQYRQILDLLAQHLKAYAANPNPADSQVIGDALRWLREAKQAREVVEAIERRHSYTNLYAQASQELVLAILGRPVDEVTPVEDCILETAVYGTGHAVGQVTPNLTPSGTRAAVDMILRSNTATNTVGYNGPVRIYSNGLTKSASRKRLILTADGLSALPAATNAVTDTDINCIDANGRALVEHFAWRRAGKQKPLAEQIAARHAEQKINARFDEQTAEQIAETNRRYREKIRRPLVLRGLFPTSLNFSTTQDTLHVAALQARDAHDLAAPTAPPEMIGQPDLGVRLHESMINNFAEGLLGGMIVTEQELQQNAQDLLGYVPDRLKDPDEAEPWSITFAQRLPISVAFTSGGFSATIRGISYTRGANEYPGMNVTATYDIKDQPLRALRQGDLTIFPPGFSPDGGQRLSAREQVLRNLLERRFQQIFPQEIVPEPITPEGEQLAKVGKLVLTAWRSTPGWMTLGWDRVAAEAEVAAVPSAAK